VSTEDDLRRYYRNRAKRLLDADRKWDVADRAFLEGVAKGSIFPCEEKLARLLALEPEAKAPA
jgi:hypothetical protein